MSTAIAPAIERITITADHFGRSVAVIPDAVAVRLRTAILAGWKEYRGDASGESRTFVAGEWEHDATAQILDAIAAADMPPATGTVTDRDRVVDLGYSITSVVGESDWDASAAWWRDYSANVHLHVPGYPERAYSTRGYRWSG
jgi:hypothetical protein